MCTYSIIKKAEEVNKFKVNQSGYPKGACAASYTGVLLNEFKLSENERNQDWTGFFLSFFSSGYFGGKL